MAELYALSNAVIRPVGDSAEIQPVDVARATTVREALEALVLLAAPMMPHLAETCWQALGNDKLVAQTALAGSRSGAGGAPDSVTIAVQVNGKRRGEVTVAKTADNASVEKDALALDAVIRALEGKIAEKGDRCPTKNREYRRMKRPPPPFGIASAAGHLPHNAAHMRSRPVRRSTVNILMCLLLGACGFHPMYAGSLERTACRHLCRAGRRARRL